MPVRGLPPSTLFALPTPPGAPRQRGGAPLPLSGTGIKWVRDARMRGGEGREALPHTPFKELFEKSSLKIFKNFEQVKFGM